MKKHAQGPDIVISGGGIAGCAMALAIHNNTSYRPVIIEPVTNHWEPQEPTADARVIALSALTWQAFADLKIQLEGIPTAPILSIRVSDRRHFGQAHLVAKDMGVTSFGHVVHLRALGKALFEQVKQAGIEYIEQQSPQQIIQNKANIEVSTQAHRFLPQLLIIAEGARSPSRERLAMSTRQKDYDQVALIANIQTQKAHHGEAFERFSQHGPIAFLPLPNTQVSADESCEMSIVWCMSAQQAATIKDDSPLRLEATLQRLFGDRLGKLRLLSELHHYPLQLNYCEKPVSHRVACIANAAQSLHPIAGQGFNLGMRDIQALCHAIQQNALGSYAQLSSYQQSRRDDRSLTLGLTETLLHSFSNHSFPLAPFRGLALQAMNHSSMAQQAFADMAMGRRK